MPIVLKSGSLNQLELSGPVQASTGIALPYLHVMTLPIFHFSPGIFAFRELDGVLVWKPEGKRRWEDTDVDLYTFLLPKSRVLTL